MRRAIKTLAVVSASLTATGAHADITISGASITGGNLVVTGSSPTGTQVKLDNLYAASINTTSRKFTFSRVYLPPDCIIELSLVGATAPVKKAVVANCGPRGVRPTGAWSNNASYATDDLAVLGGSTWRARRANLNQRPDTHPAIWEKFVSKGDTGTAGALGPQGSTGSAGPQGVQGPQGSAGPQGAKGATGADGAQGPQGPAGSGILSTFSFVGDIGSGPFTNMTEWGFVGPTVSTTLPGTRKITGVASIPIAVEAASPAIFVDIGLCYQASGAANPSNFLNPDYMTVKISATRAAQSVSSTASLPGGTYQFGACIRNDTATPVSNNDFVNGWILVHN